MLRKKIGMLLLRLGNYDVDKVPFPLYKHIYDEPEAFRAGSSIHYAIREFEFERKVYLFKRRLWMTFPFVLAGLLFIIPRIVQSDTFLYGFFQNLLADLCLAFIAAYIFINRIFEKPKELHFDLVCYPTTDSKWMVQLVNQSNEIFLPHQMKVELLFHTYNAKPLFPSVVVGTQPEISEYANPNIWKNYETFYKDERICIFELTEPVPDEIYYSISTIYGDFPSPREATRELTGAGYSKIVQKSDVYKH